MLTRILPANVGAVDRMLRVVLGLALLALVFFGPKTPWGWLGIIPLATALIGSCPVYTALGISTCPVRTRTR